MVAAATASICCRSVSAQLPALSERAPQAVTRPAPHDAPKPQPFYIGVYLYEYRLAAAATAEGRAYGDFLDQHLRILRNHGVNAIYLGGASPERFADTLRLAEKHGMMLIPQLDFAYFQPTWSPEHVSQYAKTAGQFINRYRGDPRVLAWSVREEVPRAAVEGLAAYYAEILKYAPDARFNMIHNSIDAAAAQPPPRPAIYGTDRYAFWFEISGGGYLASPSFALDWTRREAARYYEQAAARDADFMLVVTQGGLLMPKWANQIVADPAGAGVPGDADAQRKLSERVRRLAEQGRMGWQTITLPDGQPRYNVWKYYRLPPNCMKALAWTAVLEGAKLFFCWSYDPPAPPALRQSATSAATQPSPPDELAWFTLAGRPGLDNPQLEELAQAAREIRAYDGIIGRMRKVPESPLECGQPGIHHRAFEVPATDGAGQVVVIHNANVGRWPADSRHFFREDDEIQIDDAGNLVGFVPLKDATAVHFTLQKTGAAGDARAQEVIDLRTGEPVAADKAGGYQVSIGPGSGTLIYVGSAEGVRRLKVALTAP